MLAIKKLIPTAITPSRATPGAVGYDLYSTEGYVVQPGARVVVSTGIQIGLPPGVYGRIASRSGLTVKHGIEVGAGVVDPDYQGEVKVVLFNHDPKQSFVIRPGYRVAQLVLEQYVTVPIYETDEIVFGADQIRGSDGFGSTGV
jgi:dUTP pyrophosphatase